MDLLKKVQRHTRTVQFIEYLVGGGVYFWGGMAVFAVLYSGAGMDWLSAKLIADTVGWSANFFIQRYWAFNSPSLKNKTFSTGKRYVLVTFINFLLDYAIVASLKSFGVSPYLGMIISSLFFTAWNYLWYRFWVFDPKQKSW